MAFLYSSAPTPSTYRPPTVPLRRRLHDAKEAFKCWLQRYPLLERFAYLCYLIILLPFFGVVSGGVGLIIAGEWVVKQAKWCAKRWRERNLLTPEELSSRKRARAARDAVREFPRKRNRRLTMGERRVAIRDELEAAPESWPLFTAGGHMRRTLMNSKRVYGGKATVFEQLTADQLGKSHFWRFPFEVREKIWRYAVGGHHIHIVRRRGRLGNVYCPADDPTDPLRRDLCLETRDEHGFHRPTAWPQDIRPLSLLLSCRQMYNPNCFHTPLPTLTHDRYSECIDVVYMLNTFAFDEAPTMHTFLTHLLPYRKYLIAHIHLAPNFGNDTYDIQLRGRTFSATYTPPANETHLWRLPNLRSLTVTPSRDRIKPDPCGSQRLLDSIRFFVDEIATTKVDGPFTLAWPEDEGAYRSHFSRGWWGRDDYLPPTRNFELRRIPPRSSVELLAFFFPFHVQCLHCASYTIIRKATKGFAEACYYKCKAGDLIPTRVGQTLARYWTFHSYCGGWIELEYDYKSKVWCVTQGARVVDNEEAEAHLAESGDRYPRVVESAHEMLQGLENKTMTTWNAGQANGRALDSPTRESFYRYAGWS